MNLVMTTGGEKQLSWQVVTIFWSFWTIFLGLMAQLGVTDKLPWTDFFEGKEAAKKAVDPDATKDSHDHGGKPCGGHGHAH